MQCAHTTLLVRYCTKEMTGLISIIIAVEASKEMTGLISIIIAVEASKEMTNRISIISAIEVMLLFDGRQRHHVKCSVHMHPCW